MAVTEDLLGPAVPTRWCRADPKKVVVVVSIVVTVEVEHDDVLRCCNKRRRWT